jgi:hypothetical protein
MPNIQFDTDRYEAYLTDFSNINQRLHHPVFPDSNEEYRTIFDLPENDYYSFGKFNINDYVYLLLYGRIERFRITSKTLKEGKIFYLLTNRDIEQRRDFENLFVRTMMLLEYKQEMIVDVEESVLYDSYEECYMDHSLELKNNAR